MYVRMRLPACRNGQCKRVERLSSRSACQSPARARDASIHCPIILVYKCHAPAKKRTISSIPKFIFDLSNIVKKEGVKTPKYCTTILTRTSYHMYYILFLHSVIPHFINPDIIFTLSALQKDLRYDTKKT